MTMRRTFWRLVAPAVTLAHRAGRCSYKWVNVCVGAQRPDLFNALWQHEWYGEPVRALPDTLALGGIGYSTAVAEGLVTFRAEYFGARISFYRDDHENEDLWYVELAGRVPASHVDQAYRWVRAVFGGSHERRRAALAGAVPVAVSLAARRHDREVVGSASLLVAAAVACAARGLMAPAAVGVLVAACILAVGVAARRRAHLLLTAPTPPSSAPAGGGR